MTVIVVIFTTGHAAQVPLQPSTPASPATSMVPNSAADFSENTVYTSVEEGGDFYSEMCISSGK